MRTNLKKQVNPMPYYLQIVLAALWGDWSACLTFMTGWIKTPTSNFHTALNILLHNKPDFVLTSMDYFILVGMPRVPLNLLSPHAIRAMRCVVATAKADEDDRDTKIWEKVSMTRKIFAMNECIWNDAIRVPRAALIRALLVLVGKYAQAAILPLMRYEMECKNRQAEPHEMTLAVQTSEIVLVLAATEPKDLRTALITCEMSHGPYSPLLTNTRQRD